MTFRLHHTIPLVLLLQSALSAAPLSIPSSSGGIIDKEIEQQYEAKPVSPDKEVPLVEVDIPENTLDLPDSETVFIKEIKIEGNDIFSCKDLKKIVAPYEGRELSMKDMNDLCVAIQTKYAQAGYFLVRVYLPEQDIDDGVLTVKVLEAKLGAIEVIGNKHYKTKFILSYFNRFLGKALNHGDFLKALLLVNENTDLQVGSIFRKGKEFGTVDVVLKAHDAAPIHFSADYNTYGSRVTSIERSGVKGEFGNFFFSGDTLSVIGACGFPFNRLRFIDGIYNVPLNRRGTDVELSFLYSDFHVPQMKELDIHGKTQVSAIKFKQAMQRKAKLNTDIYSSFEYKQIQNFQQQQTSAYDKLRVFSFGCNIDYMDGFAGRNVANIVGFGGIPDFLGGLSAVDPLCSRKGAGGRFIYVDANYQRIQRLPAACFLFLSFQGQVAFNKLPLSEEFYIGGINTVRGYTLATALGDSGFCVNLEARMPPPFPSWKVPHSKKTMKEILQFTAFVDHGEIFEYGNAINDQSNRAFLTSVGVGAKIYGPWGFDCAMDVGFPLTDSDYIDQKAIFYFKIGLKIL